MKNNISNAIFSNLKEGHDIEQAEKDRLSEIAFNFCAEIANDDDLEYIIKEMTWWLKDRRRQQKEIDKSGINEEYFGGADFEDDEEDVREPLNAQALFTQYLDEQDRWIEDFDDRWNSCTGYPDEVRRQRMRLINPVVVKFVTEYEEDLKENWEEFKSILTENNYHTVLSAIEKELSKYE